MRLRPAGLWLLLAAVMLAAPGCFCCRPWGWHRCHYCGYASPGVAVSPAEAVPLGVATPPLRDGPASPTAP
jgi:hypothetical protein